jgi:hypothetical protein
MQPAPVTEILPQLCLLCKCNFVGTEIHTTGIEFRSRERLLLSRADRSACEITNPRWIEVPRPIKMITQARPRLKSPPSLGSHCLRRGPRHVAFAADPDLSERTAAKPASGCESPDFYGSGRYVSFTGRQLLQSKEKRSRIRRQPRHPRSSPASHEKRDPAQSCCPPVSPVCACERSGHREGRTLSQPRALAQK